MDETGFLDVADDLSTGSREADWRTAISRAYYAAFHKARRLLRRSGFGVPRGEQAHAYLWLRLSNAQHAEVVEAGQTLNDLRRARNNADYEVDVPIGPFDALDHVQVAADFIRLLDDLAKETAIFARVVDAIKVYERDVLREVTWHP
jgi:uncharacterized protein (UPF0332 family)